MTNRHGEPVIVATAVGPGHDGRAELVVELGYPNGGRTQLSITQEALVGALDAAGVTRAEDLLGRPWTVLIGHDQRQRPDRDQL